MDWGQEEIWGREEVKSNEVIKQDADNDNEE